MEWIDNIASIVAIKHSRRRTVTGSIDSLFFLSSIRMGYIVYLTSRINFTTHSTMEIEVDVESEEGITGERRFTTKAYLTYVAIDEEGKPISVPELLLETDEDRKKFEEASVRSGARKVLLKKIRDEIGEK
ncbi:thioesterase superfamily protein [mine drainage metagenome]|uniref:Thioesterase superfamily protein n=1 Tax=mine drainage metagenome TaxID=410659 RepID=T0Z8V0_9ZZZZ